MASALFLRLVAQRSFSLCYSTPRRELRRYIIIGIGLGRQPQSIPSSRRLRPHSRISAPQAIIQQSRHSTVTMSLDTQTYLASLQSNIRQRPIPWDGAVRAGTLTEEHYAKIRAVDKAKKPEQRKEIVEGDIDGYRLLFVGASGKASVLESASQHANVIQYILVLLSDLVDGTYHKIILLLHAFQTFTYGGSRGLCSVMATWAMQCKYRIYED